MRSLIFIFSFLLLTSPSFSATVIIDPAHTSGPSAVSTTVPKDKKQKLKAFKKRMHALKKHENADDRKLLLAILAIIIPPLAVYIHQDELNAKFWVSLILTLCFWIPGVIYSLLVVLDAI